MNAIVLAAGTASRFVPLSFEKPKGLLEVKGEILIERQIRQLKEAKINDITVVVGYKSNLFNYLSQKYGVNLVFNDDYNRYNNTSSLIRVLDRLDNTLICCSDHYYLNNVFLDIDSNNSYYATQFSKGSTNEWCVSIDEDDSIKSISVGGANAWYLAGYASLNSCFSKSFKRILSREYFQGDARYDYWNAFFYWLNQQWTQY